ncbi:MAG TPA: SMC family ATPase [Actinomycetota bacterium]
MRPIRLEVKSFTAYRDTQTIDFEGHELDLFAISGPTGSGKSSILDAVTYALFGRVERIGKQGLHQLISQGQPTMAVIFEFAVDDARYRVARRTSAKGATQVLLERGEGDGWVQAGEGADRVGTANQMIERAVGLDYEAFTRTVLLPQGRFAEFLVGEARQRRDILTDLLGLELFERLGRRAGEVKRQAEADVRAKSSVLETEYAGVSPDAVAEAEAVAKAAAHREEALAAAETTVREVHDRWSESARAIADLEACERDLRDARGVAAGVADALGDLAARTASIAAEVDERKKAVVARERAAAKATAAREKAESAWGRTVELVAVRVKAETFVDARVALAEAEEELAAAEQAIPALRAASAATEAAVTVAVADAEAAIDAFEGARSALDEAQHANLVAAVRAGVHVGDACPVCGAKIATLPKAPKAPSLDRARVALDRASAAAKRAQQALAEAERARDRAAAAVEAAEQEAERCAKAAARARTDVARLEADLATALGPKLPADPLATIDERLERLEELEAAQGEAEGDLEELRRELAEAERERDGLATELAEARGRIGGLAVAGLLERARSLADGVEDAPPPLTGKEDAAALAVASGALASLFERSADTLARAAADRIAGEREVALEAAGHLDGFVDADLDGLTVAEVLELASATRTAAAREAATAADRAAAAAEKLANAEAIVEQITGARTRAEVFDALARELRQDRLIAFLQVEALQVLAAAGSERLSALSQGRYRLEYADDEFSVVDTWNGEERRSARTLSGGETFLASLALALALSEQVRSLAVTEKARLDSLFLDEGFGTLDHESLEVVVEAIEQLGGDGRMVGVITHVQELAIRLPARVEIEKSPRGSSVRVVR